LLLFGCGLTFPWALADTQSQIQQLYEEAQSARERGDLSRSEQLYLEVIRRSPQLANAYHNLGIVYFMEHKYGDAATVLERAVKLAPQLAGPHIMLGLAYYELYQPGKAAAALQAGLRFRPDDANALLYLGKSQIQAHDYHAAATTLEKLQKMKPKDPDVLYSLSLSYMKLMLENFNRLGEVAPRSYQAWLLLAQDAEARGNDEAALQNYRQALRAKPDAAGIRYALGSVYARLGKFDEAAQEFKKELEINPNDSLALWKLGELTLRSSPQKAGGYLEQAIRLNPELPQALLAYGRALARSGQTEKAVEQFRRVAQLAPEEDSVHYHLAGAYRRLGRDEEAKRELARFEELAKKKDERTQQMARQLIEMTRTAQETEDEPEPGFSASRDPIHP
jgi:tetratricopeptide (TPR) repeat protein